MSEHIEQVAIGFEPDTPFGRFWIAVSERGLVYTTFQGSAEAFSAEVRAYADVVTVVDQEKVAPAAAQVRAYFDRRRREFDLPIDWSLMPPFQQQALRLVAQIPYGQWRTYGDIAHELGSPGSARAVGQANATNPLIIVIPCHRVLGSDGKLHGYGGPGGIETKAWLLRHEGSYLL